MAKTQVFEHKGYIGIQSDFKSEGLMNDPSQPGQLGFVLNASQVEMSLEAINSLQKVPKSGDDIGEVDVFKTNDGTTIFGFLGGPLKAFKPEDITGSNTYDASKLKDVAIVIPNNPPKEFIDFIDNLPQEQTE